MLAREELAEDAHHAARDRRLREQERALLAADDVVVHLAHLEMVRVLATMDLGDRVDRGVEPLDGERGEHRACVGVALLATLRRVGEEDAARRATNAGLLEGLELREVVVQELHARARGRVAELRNAAFELGERRRWARSSSGYAAMYSLMMISALRFQPQTMRWSRRSSQSTMSSPERMRSETRAEIVPTTVAKVNSPVKMTKTATTWPPNVCGGPGIGSVAITE